jgi:hypothetical protein
MPTEANARFEDLKPREKLRRTKLWAEGNLSYKWHDGQRRADTLFEYATENEHGPRARWFLMDVARRWGKSYYGISKAVSKALIAPRQRIPYVAPTKEMVKGIINPLMAEIIQDASPDYRPRFIKNESSWVFQNDSRIIMVGADRNPDAARGTHLDFGVIDEGAFCEDLQYILESILFPQMQGKTDARLLMLSTPPVSPLHPWTSKYLPTAVAKSAHYKATIEDNPRLSKEEVAEFIEMAGGRESITCRREYFCEHIVDEDKAILPEFRRNKARIVRPEEDCPIPPFYDAYVSMDPGAVDLWATLFGIYDFVNARLIIQDELVIKRTTTEDFAHALRAKEQDLWGKPAYLRVTDTAPQMVWDLLNTHKLYFQPTQKDDKQAALNKVRLWIQSNRLWIHDRCKTTIAHLEYGIWNDRGTSYARIKASEGGQEQDYGHFDCIDALTYLVRNIEVSRNPYPHEYAGLTLATHQFTESRKVKLTESKQTLADLFGGRARHLGRNRG